MRHPEASREASRCSTDGSLRLVLLRSPRRASLILKLEEFGIKCLGGFLPQLIPDSSDLTAEDHEARERGTLNTADDRTFLRLKSSSTAEWQWLGLHGLRLFKGKLLRMWLLSARPLGFAKWRCFGSGSVRCKKKSCEQRPEHPALEGVEVPTA